MEQRISLLEHRQRQSESLADAQLTIMTRVEELTEVSNSMVLERTAPNDSARLGRVETELSEMRTEMNRTNQLLADLLQHIGRPNNFSAGATPQFKSHVVKPVSATPAAGGGPYGSSGRP